MTNNKKYIIGFYDNFVESAQKIIKETKNNHPSCDRLLITTSNGFRHIELEITIANSE